MHGNGTSLRFLVLIAFVIGMVGLPLRADDKPEKPSDAPPKQAPAPKADRIELGSEAIVDRKPLPFWDEEEPELKSYLRVLGKAHQTSAQAFATAARRDMTYAHLFDETAEHRGEVVRVAGVLRQLHRIEPTPWGATQRKVRFIYEGWVYDPMVEDANPVCLHFTDLPMQLVEGNHLDQPISFDGYLFKKVRFRTKHAWRDAPLVIGQRPTLLNRPPESGAQLEMKRAALAAVSVVGAGGLDVSLTTLHAGTWAHCWPDRLHQQGGAADAGTEDTAQPIDLSAWTVQDKAPIGPIGDGGNPFGDGKAYLYVLKVASRTSPAAFAKGARRDLTFPHFWNEPEKHRGQPVHLQGTLTRLRRFDPPTPSIKEGIKDLYEGWVFDPKIHGANPMCLVFTELPKGLKVGEKVEEQIEFDGFFFKRYRYQDAAKQWRDAPLIIGRSPVVVSAPATAMEEGLTHGRSLVSLFLGLVVGTLVLVLVVAYWYNRGDQQVRRRLVEMNAADFVAPTEATEPGSPRGHRPMHDDFNLNN